MLDRPIFIIGHQRSGTSLLRSCLERSGQVWSVGREAKPIWETYFHPSTRGWSGNALGAEDATPEVCAALHRDLFEIAGRPYRAWTDRDKIDFLKWMRVQGVNPYYYDCSYELLREHFPGPVPVGPPRPHESVDDEITPYCFPIPSRRPEPGQAIRIVEKSIQSCFRIPFLRRAFPDAKYVFIVRDGRASIASSMNAWLHPRCFFSYEMPVELEIGGYSDVYPWGKRWWNLCLPPGWRDLIGLSIEQVCAEIWKRTNEHALAHLPELEAAGDAVLVRYEDLVADPAREMERIASVVEIPVDAALVSDDLPVVMSETAPGAEKWRAHEQRIRRIGRDIASLQVELGYPAEVG